MPRPKGLVVYHGWYAIQRTDTGEWLSSLRAYASWSKLHCVFLFSASRKDAIWYRRKHHAELYLRRLIRQKGPHYQLVKEESAGPEARKKRLRKEAHAHPSKPAQDPEA